MRTLGMIGGVGPESTIDYYRNIVAMYRERKGDGSYPQFVINSIDLKTGLDFMEAGKLDGMADFLLREIEKLPRAGAEFAIIAANTPHIVFDQIAPKSPVPLISIVEATCAHAKARRLKRLALFGTKFTMQADFYQKVFARAEIDLVVPEPKDQDYIHEKYFAELVPGNFLPETRVGLLAIVDQMNAKIAIDGVILAGTELPLILRDETHNGVALLDTGKIHCQAAVNEMFL
ncbi:MAG TPA: amino acid racemase [Chthoniobacterales bacterium]|nr:amino acid racemase [Chthoniobacterales bacterium]